MPLNFQTVDIRLGAGQNEGEYDFPLEPPAVTQLLNARIEKGGGIETRRGYTSAAAHGTGTGERVFGYRGVPHIVQVLTAPVDGTVARISALNSAGSRLDPQGGAGCVCAVSEVRVEGRDEVARDASSEINPTTGALYSTGSGLQLMDGDWAVDDATGLAVQAWSQVLESSATAVGVVSVFARIIDVKTGAVVTKTKLISVLGTAGAGTRCINHNGNFYVLYHTSVGGALHAVAYNQTTRAWGTNTTLVTDVSTTAFTQHFDAVQLENDEDTAWYLIYRDTTPRLVIKRYVNVTASHTVTEASTPGMVGAFADGTNGRLWYAWYDSALGKIYCKALNTSTLASTLVAKTEITSTSLPALSLGLTLATSTSIMITATFSSTAADRWLSYFWGFTTAASVGTPSIRYGVGFISRPRLVGSVLYAGMLYDGNGCSADASIPSGLDSQGFATAFTVALTVVGDLQAPNDVESWRVAASWMPGHAGTKRFWSPLSNFWRLYDDPDVAARLGVWAFMANNEIRQRATGNASSPYVLGTNGVDFCRQSFDASDRFKVVEFGDLAIIAGGVTSVFDGQTVSEYGFWWPPEGVSMADGGAGGASSAGTYAMGAHWEYRLATGDIVRSAPSIVLHDDGGATTKDFLTLAASHSIDLLTNTLTLTQKFNADTMTSSAAAGCALLRFYRTEANGSVYYLDAAVVDSALSFANNPLISGQAYQTATAAAPDSVLLTQEQIYTNPSEASILPNYAFPATDDLCVWQDRLWGISSEDKRDLFFTHVKQQGELPGWHPFLTLRIEDGGDAIAMTVLDDKLVVFKRDSIFIVYGQGPDRKGVGGDYDVVRIQTEHGCRDRRSIATVPQGVMFASRRGICLLSRKLDVAYVGGPVEDSEASKEYVAACALADEEMVYFYVRNAACTTGGTLVFHWDVGQWAIDINKSNNGDGGPTVVNVPNAAAYVNGVLYVEWYGGLFLYKHSGYKDSDTEFIPMSLTTPWMKLGAMQNFGRCRWASLLGSYSSKHGLTMSVSTDYTTSGSQTVTFTDAEVLALDRYQMKAHVANQKGQSYRFVFLTTAPIAPATSADWGKAAIWNSVELELGVTGGIRRRPDGGMRG